MSAMYQSLTNYTVTGADNVMDVRTEKLAPIVSSKYRYTFRFDTPGYLDRNTMLLFKPVAKDGTVSSAGVRANCFNGNLGAIRNVELMVGDYTITRIDDSAGYSTLNQLLTQSPAVQNKVYAHYVHNNLKYKVAETAGTNASDVVGAIEPDPVNSGINYGDTTSGAGAAINSVPITNTASNNDLVGIPLGMLLPVLAHTDLPLFLFSDYKVHLVIEFESDSSKWANKMSKNNYAGGEHLASESGDVEFTDVELLVDYLIFPSRIQNGVREKTQQQGGYQLAYPNVELVEKTIPSTTALANQQVEHRINVVNKEVHYVQMIKTLPVETQDKVLLDQRAQSVSIEEIQWNVNGSDVYPEQPIFNPVSQYNQCTYALGRDLNVPKPLYVADCNTQASLLSPCNKGLLGKYKPLCLSLSNGNPGIRGSGRVISEYPIRCIYQRKGHGDITAKLAGDPIVAKSDVGQLFVKYYVAVTRVVKVASLPSGANSVLVSDL